MAGRLFGDEIPEKVGLVTALISDLPSASRGGFQLSGSKVSTTLGVAEANSEAMAERAHILGAPIAEIAEIAD